MAKKPVKRKQGPKPPQSRPEPGSKKAFDQLLGDAIFGVPPPPKKRR